MGERPRGWDRGRVSLIHPVRASHTAQPRRPAHVSPHGSVRQVVRVVSDGTGRSPEEIWIMGAALTAVAVAVAAVKTVNWLIDLTTDVQVWPLPPRP